MGLVNWAFKFHEKNQISSYIAKLIIKNINKGRKKYPKQKFIDMHMHTFYSDGIWSPFDMILGSAKKGLDGCAITDHNTFENYYEIKKAVKKIKKIYPGFIVIPGAEISTKEGHIGVYYNNIKHDAIKKLVKIRKIENLMKKINTINSGSGEKIIAVPFHYWRFRKIGKNRKKLIKRIKKFKNFYGLEAVNGDYLINKTKDAGKLNVSPIAGSDAHSIFRIGAAFTIFNKNVKDINGIFYAIKNKKTNVSFSHHPLFKRRLIAYSYLFKYLNPFYFGRFVFKNIPQIIR